MAEAVRAAYPRFGEITQDTAPFPPGGPLKCFGFTRHAKNICYRNMLLYIYSRTFLSNVILRRHWTAKVRGTTAGVTNPELAMLLVAGG